jgi:predicted alpha-1,2-mannosidase
MAVTTAPARAATPAPDSAPATARASAAQIEAGLAADPTSLVNPFIGTGSGGDVVGSVNTFPGAVAPFGMLSWSPETPSRPAGGGYNYADSSTLGLSLTHLSGVGCGIQGDLPILPTVGDIGATPARTAQPFTHADERTSPGFYATRLGADRAIDAQVAATTRTGIGQFDFPATAQANMLFKVGASQNGNSAAEVRIEGDNKVTGTISGGRFCDTQNASTVYFAATFDRPFSAYGTWSGATVTPGSASGSGPTSGAWVTFDATATGQVGMKVAISYVSVANAWANLQAESSGWQVAAVAEQTRAAWRQLLSKIQVGGGTHDQQVQFYTALYHSLLHPNVFSDANGQYLGFDGRVHTVAPGKAQYANFSGWDIYRTLVQLQAMLAPEESSQMMQSLVNDAAQGGWLPKWPVSNGYTGVMNGDAADPMIASAYAFGARDFDTRAALAAMVKGAEVVPTADQLGQGYYEQRPGLADYKRLGYVPNAAISSISHVPNGASETLEYALADFSIAQFAEAIGQESTHREYHRRSQNWTNLFNVNSGFLQPRDGDGRFPAGNPVTTGMGVFGQSGFQEGNAAQYLWMVPQNVRGLFSAIGGNDKVIRRLDTFLSEDNVGPNRPYYWAGNEVNMLVPWLYNYAGAPYKTQETVRRLLTTVYSNTPGGEPGNDDLGALSSWYVWSAIGLYPTTPGTDTLAVSSPLFSTVRLNLSGSRVEISAPGASSKGYVQALSINGRPSERAWLSGDLLTGRDARGDSVTTIKYTLSEQPNRSWGAGKNDQPPSYPVGPLKFPPGVTPVDLATTPATTTVTVGAQTASTLTFHVGAGAEPAKPTRVRSIAWRAAPPTGVTVTPTSGTAAVAPDGTATVNVTVSAANNAKQGFDSVIPITLTSTPAVSLPRLDLPIAVVGPGDTARTCTTLGAANVDNGLTQVETSGDGVTTPVTVGGQSGRQTVERVPGGLHMYFRLDSRIASNGNFSTTFTFNYYDSGTNSWTLQYDAHGGSAYTRALAVTNQGTNTWKTATVTVDNAGFAQRQNARSDFRIASAGPVTIHSVQTTVSGPGVLSMDLCGAAASGS